MPAPLAKGIIIAASVIVAAGIAIYESPQVRQWVDQSRRKIAVALHSLGDDIQPRRSSESSDNHDAHAKRREELIRRNRNELIRRAREEGVAVDLDELARIGDEAAEMGRKRHETSQDRSDRAKSFDTLVGHDGMLRGDTTGATNNASDAGLRHRGVSGFAAGSSTAANTSTPFSDDAVLFDHNDQDDEAPSPKPFPYIEPTTTLASNTVPASSPPSSTATLMDLTPEQHTHEPPATNTPTTPQDQSFHSFTSPSRPSTPTQPQPQSPSSSPSSPFTDADADAIVTPTLTPRSTRPPSPFSDTNFTDAAFSDTGYSDLGGDRVEGVMTPGSWTDVGSEEGSEWGGLVGGSVG
ncbi:hypothetical protein IAQ61_000724 [Plenodomus lingam]|uniref:uncharacterized protein n=1 Tax=Leptosphaeria maculans TaxID=5022 RepID=UPI003327094D|nr:hypothetical protein IAQ61_000724 [Plenodomus lingam]